LFAVVCLESSEYDKSPFLLWQAILPKGIAHSYKPYLCRLNLFVFCFVCPSLAPTMRRTAEYLGYDTQMIMGGRKHELSPEEYIYGAMQLYCDVVNLFMIFLSLFGVMSRD
uniref:ABC2_membrane domain-containing protein n=1 Tax=Hydatigena taeniaeformis TaxID=6205 RepID=A0A0R3X297_HYDTA